MDVNLIEQQNPQNLDKILIIKNSKNKEIKHDFGNKINVQDDNVVNTVTFINIDSYQRQQDHVFSGDKLINVINFGSFEKKVRTITSGFFPEYISEPVFKNPMKLQSSSQISINLWTFEERELLKKALLSYGYGRWERIKLSFEKK